jgi:CRISPR/Cas system CSM-associated protein Csm3 (group 7 of RAMP superfamily)
MSEAYTWQNRWLITGTLTTLSPLHIGGDLPLKKDIYPMADKKKKETVEVTTVVTDYKGHAYIPGSAIKGNIREWMEANGYDKAAIEEIFGSPHYKKEGRLGGRMEFADCFAVEPFPTFSDIEKRPPYWNWDKGERLTGITASVAIDRMTGTAADKKLFHYEYVPEGISFNVTITGQDVDKGHIEALVHALENGFSKAEKNPITLGASTANGWGRLEWKRGKISRMTKGDVDEWLKKPVAGYRMLESLLSYDLKPEAKPKAKQDTIEIGIKLKFDGPFLVNDKSKSKAVTGDEHQADFNPRRDTKGNVILPSESFRGAFRSQAEKIIRTVGGNACSPKKPCKAILKKENVKKLCLACRLFGASGWKTALDIPPFELAECKENEFRQDFIAVDRFTGGAKDGAKFDAMSVLDPLFSGVIRVDKTKVEDWGFGLLALTLRDLAEGDITFGFGAAKGYGACRAEVKWPADKGKEFLKKAVESFVEEAVKGGKHYG